jgi:hypothetical protein
MPAILIARAAAAGEATIRFEFVVAAGTLAVRDASKHFVFVFVALWERAAVAH